MTVWQRASCVAVCLMVACISFWVGGCFALVAHQYDNGWVDTVALGLSCANGYALGRAGVHMLPGIVRWVGK